MYHHHHHADAYYYYYYCYYSPVTGKEIHSIIVKDPHTLTETPQVLKCHHILTLTVSTTTTTTTMLPCSKTTCILHYHRHHHQLQDMITPLAITAL